MLVVFASSLVVGAGCSPTSDSGKKEGTPATGPEIIGAGPDVSGAGPESSGAGPQVGQDPISKILGFEGAEWTVTGGSTAPSPDFTEGTGALLITNPANELDLLSPPLSSGAASLAGISDDNATVSLDMMLPRDLANPHNSGSLQLWVSCPSRHLDNVYLGKVDLKGVRLGIFRTVRFSVPGAVSAALRAPGWTDLIFHFRLHSPGQESGTYVFDNLRVHSASSPPPDAGRSIDLVATLSYNPPLSTPGFATFLPTVIQIPQSFHLKLGSAGKGTATFELGRSASAPQIACTYAASKDGHDYVFASCSGGFLAGDLVKAEFVRLTILGGNPAAGVTKIHATLSGNPVGDTVGEGVIPPMPTFWGDTPESTNQIATEYFNAATRTTPQEETWIAAPVGEFARRTSNGLPANGLAGLSSTSDLMSPASPSVFVKEGHLAPGKNWDGYWRLTGELSMSDGGGSRHTTHFRSDLSAHAVLWGMDVEFAKLYAGIDTDNGEVSSGGISSPSSSASLKAYLFGIEVPGGGDGLASFEHTIGHTASFDAPPIQIWIFYIQVGLYGTVELVTSGAVSAGGFNVSVTPRAAVGAHLEGGVSIVIARGGVAADIDLISAKIPLTANAGWTISTDPAICSGSLDFRLRGDAAVGTLGGAVSLVATFGVCPFCVHGSLPIFSWDPLPVASEQLFQYGAAAQVFPLPPATCRVPLEVAITSPGSASTVVAGISTSLQGSVTRPATPGAPARPISCSHWTWTSSNPNDVGFPATGCAPAVTFKGSGSRTITLTASDEYGEAGSVSRAISVVPCPGATPPNFGQQCGSCGGQITCDGTCSIETPPDLGASCGSCGGTIACGGGCSVQTPGGYGQSCGGCGGTTQCDGTCSIATPQNLGTSCGSCGGVISCGPNGTGVCSGPANCGVVGEISPTWGYWGDWTAMAHCPPGAYASGYQLRSEPEQGGSEDDTGLNAIRLFCSYWYGDPVGRPLEPHPGYWGNWGDSAYCPAGSFMRGASMLIEGPQGEGSDDTSANNVAAVCSDGTGIQAQAFTSWGSWTDPWVWCPPNTAICGVAARVEPPQGGDDDTALNGLIFECCGL